MPSYVPPKKNTEYIFYIGLPAQGGNTFQSNPTIAAGDFKVSTDGGTLGNLTTLPTVTPASGKMVKITLSAAEMNGDNVTVVCSDAAGSEWDDVIINIQTSATQQDDTRDVNVLQISGDATAADNLELFFDGTGYNASNSTVGTATNVTNQVTANVTAISGDSVAADNCEAFFDGTGYAGTNNVIPTVTTLTGHTPQTGDSYARLGAPVGASISADIATVDANVDAILVDTAEIGTAGAGLTNIPWNASWDAEVQSEVEDGLIAHGLDHLVGASVADTDVADNSIIAKLVDSTSITADFTNYDWTTDSLRALRDRGDAAWITATGFSTHTAADVWTNGTRTLTANTNLNDPTAATIADAVWDELQADHTTVGTFGILASEVADILADTNELQTDWTNGGRLDLIIDELTTNIDAIETDTQDLQTQIGTAGAGLTAVPWNAAWDAEVESEVNDGLVALGLDHLVSAAVVGTDVTDNSIVAKLVSASATADFDDFVNTTDSLQAIRDRGDAAWTTGGGGSNPILLQNTTIATLASQTSFTLTAGSADDDAYNGCFVVVTDSATSEQKAVGRISDYTGSTKTVTLNADPAVFTMAAGDTIDILANALPYADEIRTELDSNSTQLAAIVADTNELQTDWANGGRLDLIIDELTTNIDAIETDTQDIQTQIGTAGAGLTAVPWNAAWDAEVQSEVNDGLTAFWTSPATLVDLVWDEALTGATHNVTNSAGRRLRGVQEFQGYDNGAVWIDTVSGTAGTVSYENGTVENPVDTIADANTISAAINLHRFNIAPNSSITFAATQSNEVFIGDEWTLALGGQNIAGSKIIGATVSGIATGSTPDFEFCHIGNVTLAPSRMLVCGLSGTLTVGSAGDYFLIDCYSEIAGASSPTLDMGAAVGATNVSIRRWSGGITINNLAAGDVVSLDGTFGTVTLNGADAQVEIRGIAKAVTNNLTGSPTVNDKTVKADDIATIDTNVDAVLVDTGTTLPATLGTPTGADLATDIANVQTDTTAILADTGTDGVVLASSQVAVKKNTALANFMFVMTDDTNHVPTTGYTVTATRSIDGAAFASCANSVSEVANGVYAINLAASDLNGDVITLRFAATNADDQLITIITQA